MRKCYGWAGLAPILASIRSKTNGGRSCRYPVIIRFQRDLAALLSAAASAAFLRDITAREALLVLSVLDPELAAAILVPI
jgi:hypothetical protein